MPLRILVIDDDALSREVFALLLQDAGYVVETVDSGDAALLYLQTAPSLPQIILSDQQMPGTTGNELARQLRNLCGPATTLLAMSASAPEDGSDQEFDRFLLKPFTMETFAAAIASRTSNTAKKTDNATVDALDEGGVSKARRIDATPSIGATLQALPCGRRTASCDHAAGGVRWRRCCV